jgi:caspase domain-containing protein/uncharacterized protein DUF4384
MSVVLAAALALAAGPTVEPAGVRRALLIGVNDYATQEFGDLNGAVNDVEAMKGLLVSRFGFDPANVPTMTDRQATREAILAAIRRLVAASGPRDTLYVHFSGHGSQVRDLDGDEPDGQDETLVPSDGRTPGVPDITDDELGALLAGVQAENCVVVLDSCHSGTATRGALRTRTIPADTRTELYARLKTRSVVRSDRPERCLLLTGAAANQSALDGPVEDGRHHGMFSYALARALASEPATDPATATHDLVQTTFRGLSESFGGVFFPDPQFEGTASRLSAPIFPSGGAPTAAPMGPPAPAARFAIRLDVPDAQRKSAIAALLRERAPEVDLVGPESFARFAVTASASRWEVRDGAGLSVVAAFDAPTDAEAVSRLAAEFERSRRASALIALTNPASRLSVAAQIAGQGADAPMRVRRPGDARTTANSLQLEIRTSADAFLTIVDVDAEGVVNVLFPNAATKPGFLAEGFVRAGAPVRIPDSLSPGNAAGFFWDVRPPGGIDTIQVFATSDIEAARTIRRWLQSAPTVTRGGPTAPAPPIDAGKLTSLGAQLVTRGFAVVKDEPAVTTATPTGIPDWNASLVRVRIEN